MSWGYAEHSGFLIKEEMAQAVSFPQGFISFCNVHGDVEGQAGWPSPVAYPVPIHVLLAVPVFSLCS